MPNSSKILDFFTKTSIFQQISLLSLRFSLFQNLSKVLQWTNPFFLSASFGVIIRDSHKPSLEANFLFIIRVCMDSQRITSFSWARSTPGYESKPESIAILSVNSTYTENPRSICLPKSTATKSLGQLTPSTSVSSLFANTLTARSLRLQTAAIVDGGAG